MSIDPKRTRTEIATANQFIEVCRNDEGKAGLVRGTILNLSGGAADIDICILKTGDIPADIVANPPTVSDVIVDRVLGMADNTSIAIGAQIMPLLEPDDVVFVYSSQADVIVTIYNLMEAVT